MVDREILPAFVEHLKIALKEYYPNGTKSSPDYGRIINRVHLQRIKKMLDNTTGQILIGGEVDEKDSFIDVTVVQVDDINKSMIVDKSFGPLIPILPIDSLEEAVRIVNSIHRTPLAFYPFGNKTETNKCRWSIPNSTQFYL